jgi:uncharacterized protein YjiS (DUF1127 family)
MTRVLTGQLNPTFAARAPRRPTLARRAVACALWPRRALVAAERRRREREALSGLDDRMLRDIGVTRSQVAALTRSYSRNEIDDPA